MLKIIVGDVSSQIEHPELHPNELVKLREICRARPENFMFMPKYKAGLWDGYISLLHGFAAFPTGLLGLVTKGFDRWKIPYQIVKPEDTAAPLTVTADMLTGVTLRDYQVEAANVMLARKRGILRMATNSGKTEVMAAVIKTLNVNTLVVVHRKELMYQTAERFANRGVMDPKDIGIIGDGHFEPKKLTVGMIQSLWAHRAKAKEVFSKNQLLICDELHHASSDTMMSVLNIIPGSYRFGLSGTPLRYEILADMKVMSVTGDLIYDLDNAYLIAEGYSARPIVHIGVVELKDERWWKADYQTAYDTLLVHNEQRNQKIADFALAQHGTVLILVDRVEHGFILQGLMPYATYVTGSDTTARRRGVLDNMREAKDGIYIATPIFDEGVDVPGVNAVVIAGGGASSIRVLQRIGRGLRHKEGINQLNVLDFVDDTNRILFDHSDARITTYVEEGFETVMDGEK